MSQPPCETQIANDRRMISKVMPDQLSQLLYAARWLGMLLVLGVHATGGFMNFNEHPQVNINFFASAWRFFISYHYGRQAVIGFFVMSGYLVGGQVLARLDSRKPFLRDYFIHRIVRIYMVIIPATVITFLFDTFGRHIFPANYGSYAIFEGHYAPRYILTNLINMQGILAIFYGTNGPLWSIGYEFWYYIIFPLLLAPIIISLDARRAKIYAILTLVFCVVVSLRQIWFPFGLALWTLGAVVSLMLKPLVTSPKMAFVQFVSTGLLLGFVFNTEVIRAYPSVQYISDTATALAFANLILTVRYVKQLDWALLNWQGHKTLADFSFTLYAIHNPTLMLLRATTTAVLGPDWSVGLASREQWGALVVAMSLTIALAYALSRFTEGKVGAVRIYVKSLILRLWPDPAPAMTVAQR